MIMNFYFMHYSGLEHHDLISHKSFVTFYDNFERLLQKRILLETLKF